MLNIKCGSAIHCKTEKEALLFAKLFKPVWIAGTRISESNLYWDSYKSHTCYFREDDGRYTYGDIGCALEHNHRIIEFSYLLKGTIFGNK